MTTFTHETDAPLEADERGNPAENLKARENNSAFDDIVNNYHKTADPTQEDDNIKSAKGREGAGSGAIPTDIAGLAKKAAVISIGKGGKFSVTFQKAAPVGGVIGAILGMFGFAMFLPAGMPLISMMQTQTDAHADAARVQPMRYKSIMRYTIGNEKVAAACEKNPASIACKLGTMDKTTKEAYESNKFKIDAKEVNGRYLIKSITSPSGKTASTGDGYMRLLARDIQFGMQVRLAHNTRALTMNGGRFLRLVLPTFGLSKAPIGDISKDLAKQNKEINKLYGRSEDGKIDETKLINNITQKTDGGYGREGIDEGTGKLKLARGLAAIPGSVCLSYNSLKLVVNITKAERALYLAQVAMPYLKLASMILDSENVEVPETTVSALALMLTTPVVSGAMKGLTAFDSQGTKLIYGSNEKGLQEYTRNFLLHNNSILKTADKTMETIDSAIGKTGAKSTRSMCRAVGSWEGQAIGSAACLAIAAIQAGAGAAGGTVVPVIGNIVGGLAGGAAGVVECAVTVLASFVIGEGITAFIEKLVVPWAKEAAIAGLPDASTVGPPLGDAITVGAALMLNMNNRTNGLFPAKKSSILAYSNAIRESEQLNKQFEIAEARDEPFDVYNRYSFLGSIASTMNNVVFPMKSRMSSGNFALQRLFGSFALAPTAMAIGESASPIGAEDLSNDNCDSALKAMGADCDILSQMRYTMTPEAMNMQIEPNYAYMIANNYIDDSGNPVPDSEYDKVVKYCFERKTDIGVSTAAIESDDYLWETGRNCFYNYNDPAAKQRADNFSAFYSVLANIDNSEQTEGDRASTGGLGLKVMSYNILGASHSNDGGLSVNTRMNNLLTTMKSKMPDVVGFQEVSGMRDDVFDMLKDTYAGWPTDGDGDGDGERDRQRDGASRPIYWNKSKYEVVEKDVVVTNRYSNRHARFPYIKFREISSGKEFYVFNIHTSANSYRTPGYTSPEARAMQTKDMIAIIKEKAGYNESSKTYTTPVVTTGDYNSTCKKTGHDGSIREDQIPCKLLEAAGLRDAGIEAYSASRSGQSVQSIQNGVLSNGPVTVTNYQYNTSHGSANSHRDSRKEEGRHIDHVFYSSDFNVASWENVITTETTRTSDHTPVIAVLQGAGLGMDNVVSSGDFSYPFGEADYRRHPENYLRAHTATGSNGPTGTAWGSDNMGTTHKGAGIAVDIGAAMGREVHAMFGGTVTSVNLCGQNDGIAIRSSIGGGTLGVAYMHGTNKRFEVGDTVRAGQVIMNVSDRGCNAFGAHLHIGMAFNGRYICPQDIFLQGGQSLNFASLTNKGRASCGGRVQRAL